jgi:hypothetical protein
MANINSEQELKDAILQLESKRTDEGKELKEQFFIAYESIKPINLIKSTFKEAAASTDIQDNILTTSVGLTAGYLSKKIFEGTSHSPLKKLFGTALLFGVTQAVAKNPEAIKALGHGLLNMIRSRSNKNGNRTSNNDAK